MKQYISLLKSEHTLRKLFIVQFISYFGAWFSNVAIYTLLIHLEVQPQIIAFVASLHFLAGVFQAPISGTIIDKVDLKKLMIFLMSIEILATFFLIFINDISDLYLLYVLIFIKMSSASFYFTTEMTLVPKIVDKKNLQQANELHSIIWSLSYTLGMAVSGFVVYWLGVKVAFLVDAFLFVIGLVLLFSIKINTKKIKINENILEMMLDTFRYLKKSPKALHLMIVHSFVGLTVFDVLVALMVDEYYKIILATSLALGLLNSFRAIGLIIGPVFINRWLNHKTLTYLFIFQAITVWLWAYCMYDFYLSLFVSILVGLSTTSLWSYTYTLLHKNIEEEYYGRIIAYNDMLFLSVASFTSFFIGYLAKHNFSLEFITVLLGFCFIIGALYYHWVFKTQNIN